MDIKLRDVRFLGFERGMDGAYRGELNVHVG